MSSLLALVTLAQATGESEVVGSLIRSGAVVLISVALYGGVVRVGRRLVRETSSKGEDAQARAMTLWAVARRLVAIAIAVTAVLALFGTWGFSLAPFLAVTTVFAAAVGFGAQDLVRDMIAGFFILVEDQFRVGDTVTIASATGTVEDIQLRVTVLRDYEGNVHFVPNGQITVASNFTSDYAHPVIDIGISYDTDVDRALEVLKQELDEMAGDPEWSGRIRGEGEVLGVNKLDDSAVVIRGRLTTSAEERWTVRREALRRVKKRFDAEGITIPFPQITVHRAD